MTETAATPTLRPRRRWLRWTLLSLLALLLVLLAFLAWLLGTAPGATSARGSLSDS